ncbi:MAG TPA: CTP synthase, partial [Flavobacteriales bacterium]|nr:CTP synthase [Flavobacteriales bacterium]
VLVCRTEHHLNREIKEKVAKFCNVSKNAVIESIDASTIYEVPLLMKDEELDLVVLSKLNMPARTEPDLTQWNDFLYHLKNPTRKVKIGLVGKYIELKDSYKSIVESFIHAGAANDCKVELVWLHSESLTDENAAEKLDGLRGILVAPGFGSRGIEGKIAAIRYARENKIPFFGICLGMQCAVIEFARNVLGHKDAHTMEIEPTTKNPVIALMESQKGVTSKGGTMRLGAYPCKVAESSHTFQAYGKSDISERHRHRYEFNNDYRDSMNKAGLQTVGINPDNDLVEIVELKDHPWFVGVQFHPEYKSTVVNPHPLFVAFVKATTDHNR